MKKLKIAFHTLGCKLNYSETSFISQSFDQNRFEEVDFKAPADIFVINTCTVTAVAEKKCRNVARMIKKRNPESKIVFMGCYSELKSNEIKEIKEVDLIVGSSNKYKLPELIDALMSNNQNDIIQVEIDSKNTFFSSWSQGERTRSFLKIQDGCDYYCSYCAVPFARGNSRSDSIENVILNANKIIRIGVQEIVLTGVNIGDFGRKNRETFFDLLKQMSSITDLKRVRISSIEPNLLTDEIIEFVAKSRNIMPHFHIPLQSAHPRILSEMKRRYSLELFSHKVQKIKELMPHACIAVDVICGFPGETAEEFQQSVEYLSSIDVTYLHVFTYSIRQNTEAETLKNHVDEKEKKRRSIMLHELSEKKKLDFYNTHQLKIYDVLFESEIENNTISGFTPNYIRVKIPYNIDYINKIIPVQLKQIDSDGVYIGIVEDDSHLLAN